MRCPLAVEGALAFLARLCVSTRVEGSVRGQLPGSGVREYSPMKGTER